MKKVVLLFSLVVFTLSMFAQQTGTMKDNRDGKVYKTVKIGNQWWMAENLAYKASSGCWSYDNNISNVNTYGYLYNWETAKNICPSGWHLPSNSEWEILIERLGGKNVAGEKLKKSTTWDLFKGVNFGNNSSGFSAVASGQYDSFGDCFANMGNSCFWWSKTQNSSEDAWNYGLGNNSSETYPFPCNIHDGYSIRCIKN